MKDEMGKVCGTPVFALTRYAVARGRDDHFTFHTAGTRSNRACPMVSIVPLVPRRADRE